LTGTRPSADASIGDNITTKAPNTNEVDASFRTSLLFSDLPRDLKFSPAATHVPAGFSGTGLFWLFMKYVILNIITSRETNDRFKNLFRIDGYRASSFYRVSRTEGRRRRAGKVDQSGGCSNR
jgi:hypothetical protein